MEECIVKVYEDRTEWYQNEKRHKTDGPAIEYANGYKAWFIEGKRHRTDGPAIEYANGHKEWYQSVKQHRIDGPAVEYVNGNKLWFIEGKEYTEEEFLKKTSLVKELTVEEISKLLGYEVKIVKG